MNLHIDEDRAICGGILAIPAIVVWQLVALGPEKIVMLLGAMGVLVVGFFGTFVLALVVIALLGPLALFTAVAVLLVEALRMLTGHPPVGIDIMLMGIAALVFMLGIDE